MDPPRGNIGGSRRTPMRGSGGIRLRPSEAISGLPLRAEQFASVSHVPVRKDHRHPRGVGSRDAACPFHHRLAASRRVTRRAGRSTSRLSARSVKVWVPAPRATSRTRTRPSGAGAELTRNRGLTWPGGALSGRRHEIRHQPQPPRRRMHPHFLVDVHVLRRPVRKIGVAAALHPHRQRADEIARWTRCTAAPSRSPRRTSCSARTDSVPRSTAACFCARSSPALIAAQPRRGGERLRLREQHAVVAAPREPDREGAQIPAVAHRQAAEHLRAIRARASRRAARPSPAPP